MPHGMQARERLAHDDAEFVAEKGAVDIAIGARQCRVEAGVDCWKRGDNH